MEVEYTGCLINRYREGARKMSMPTIQVPFTNEVIQRNRATQVKQTKRGIWIYLEPNRQELYQRPDCAEPVKVQQHIVKTVTVQGLGLPGQQVRYRVKVIRVSYVNDAGEKKTFTLDVPGVRIKLKMTEAVVEKGLYFMIDRNQSLSETKQSLWDIYGVKTSVPALHRLKMAEADKLPNQGKIIRALNAHKKVTALHIDEYKAKGTRGWELIIRDEHNRLLVSLYLRKRSEKKLKIVLRWLRMLGIRVKVCYVDGWASYLTAIRAIYPQAVIQYDYFHIIQNIWRHLYRAFTTYRKAFRKAKTEKQQQALRDKMHKKLWKNRYLFFTHEANLSNEDKAVLEELLAEHKDTILERIVAFTQRIWDLFNNSPTKLTANLKRFSLIAEGWGSLSKHFAKVIDFLNRYFTQMIAYIDDERVQRHSLAETTVRMVRRIERVRQGFKSARGRAAHFKLWQHRRYLRPQLA